MSKIEMFRDEPTKLIGRCFMYGTSGMYLLTGCYPKRANCLANSWVCLFDCFDIKNNREIKGIDLFFLFEHDRKKYELI